MLILFLQVDTSAECEEEREEGLNYLWDLFTGEAETSAGDATSEAAASNIDGPKGRMVRMMKRSIQVSLYNFSQNLKTLKLYPGNQKKKMQAKYGKKRQNRPG